jgi:hypothetical protein
MSIKHERCAPLAETKPAGHGTGLLLFGKRSVLEPAKRMMGGGAV